jgi:hypothetical protein
VTDVLNEDQLGEYIDTHFKRRLFRLETLDFYDVSGDREPYADYVAGVPDSGAVRKAAWMDVIRGEVARGAHTYRVHVVRSPLTDYLRFEFEWGYVYNAQAGEHIRILDLAEQAVPADLIDEDFWLIDDEQVLQMIYDSDHDYVGANLAPDSELEKYLKASKAAWEAAVPFEEYWQAHPRYWRDKPTA